MAGPEPNTRVETFTHDEAKRWNIPTAELQSLMREDEAAPRPATYPRKYNPDEHPEMYARNPDLDPQLVWRGKEEQDRRPLTVDTVPIYVQEKIHPKAIIDDLKRRSGETSRPRTATCSPTSTACPTRGQVRVLRPRRQLVEPDDPRRLAPGHELAGREGRPARPGPDDLHRPAVRDQALHLIGRRLLSNAMFEMGKLSIQPENPRLSRRSATPGLTD